MNKCIEVCNFQQVCIAFLFALMIPGANAAQYDLALTAVGGTHDGNPLWILDGNTVTNLSTINVDEAIAWGPGGTTGTFNATDIQINYFGDTFDLSDAIGAVTVEWNDGQMIDLNYTTADFNLEMASTYNTKEWQGAVIVSEVPLPGAFLLFSSALGLLGLRSASRR